MPSEPLAILLISGGHERAHYAFVLAAGAAALGRRVTLLATNDGTRALAANVFVGVDAARDAAVRASGVAGLIELRDAAVDLGVRMIACEAGLRVAGLDVASLLPGVEIAGVATFLADASGGQIITL